MTTLSNDQQIPYQSLTNALAALVEAKELIVLREKQLERTLVWNKADTSVADELKSCKATMRMVHEAGGRILDIRSQLEIGKIAPHLIDLAVRTQTADLHSDTPRGSAEWQRVGETVRARYASVVSKHTEAEAPHFVVPVASLGQLAACAVGGAVGGMTKHATDSKSTAETVKAAEEGCAVGMALVGLKDLAALARKFNLPPGPPTMTPEPAITGGRNARANTGTQSEAVTLSSSEGGVPKRPGPGPSKKSGDREENVEPASLKDEPKAVMIADVKGRSYTLEFFIDRDGGFYVDFYIEVRGRRALLKVVRQQDVAAIEKNINEGRIKLPEDWKELLAPITNHPDYRPVGSIPPSVKAINLKFDIMQDYVRQLRSAGEDARKLLERDGFALVGLGGPHPLAKFASAEIWGRRTKDGYDIARVGLDQEGKIVPTAHSILLKAEWEYFGKNVPVKSHLSELAPKGQTSWWDDLKRNLDKLPMFEFPKMQ